MAGSPLRCRCGVRLQPGDQLLQVVRRHGFLRDDKLRVGGDHRHRLKVVQHVVLERIDRRIDDMCAPMADADRVAVGRRARDPADADGKDAPLRRAVERSGSIVTTPILSGLHHRYARI